MKILAFSAVLMWTAPVWAQRPSDADVATMIERARQKALAYTQSLPDFVATEVIHRFAGSYREGIGGHPVDTLTVQLRYSQHKEEHTLLQIDGQPAQRTFESLQGTVGSGEFGATLIAIFDPESQTAFHWQSWKNVRGRRAAVFGFQVNGPHSRYHLSATADGSATQADAGYHGLLTIDGETGDVLHLEYQADHIPAVLHLRSASTKVDYAPASVGDREYLLPSHCETEMHGPTDWARNVMDFREYQKFSTDSTVEFGHPK
jgi:hypothetical protein